METVVIGVSYKHTNIDIRGKVAFTHSNKVRVTNELITLGIPELLILSTCNRSEIYFISNNLDHDIKLVKNQYLAMGGVQVSPHLYVKSGVQAIQHIFQVATGLDSLVLGENEILGQIKTAMNTALEIGSCKKYLGKILRESISFSKQVRNSYKYSENKLSVASIGISFLKKRFGLLQNKKVLVIGSGNMGQLIIKYLIKEKLDNIYLTNRSKHRAINHTFSLEKVRLVDYQDRYKLLQEVDIVISATASPHTIIKKENCYPFTKNITFVDMAVPRDIDKAIEGEFVDIITLDTFQEISKENKNLRQDIAHKINQQIDEQVQAIELWFLRTSVDKLIMNFCNKQEEVIELKKKQLDKMDLSKAMKEEILCILKASTWEMVKKPIHQLKAMNEKKELELYKMMIVDLFNFDKESSL